MNDVYILGGAQTDFVRNWTKEGKNVVALLKEVTDDAFQNTGLTYKGIEELNKKNKIAIFIGNFAAEYYINQGHLGPLMTEVNKAFYGIPSARYEAACASGSVALDSAITKIKSGDYDVAIVIGWELMKTVDSKTGGDYLGRAAVYDKEAKGIDFCWQCESFPCHETGLDENLYKRSVAINKKINEIGLEAYYKEIKDTPRY